ncbi:MAG: MFS transporter [Nocardioides sp.]|uniref:MFS transporter n=1 Tax=Nocardioides sp. TaxID=35761 RepID=UPI0039E3D4DC
MTGALLVTDVLRARTAVLLTFMLNGFGFASYASRIPEIRSSLELTNSELGLLLLTLSAGSMVALPTTGVLVHRWGAASVVRVGVLLDALGLLACGLGTGWLESVLVTGFAFVTYGVGVALWEVGMNVEGAGVERGLGRSIMPRFHAGWSIGSVVGAAYAAVLVALGVPLSVHLGSAALVVLLVGTAATGRYLPRIEEPDGPAPSRSMLAAWLEPRTLLIGLMMLALALTEGVANDWLAVALIDGYQVPHWVGVAGFGLFVTSMTAGRFFGPLILDRHGRVPVLWVTMAVAGCGVLLIVFGGALPLVVVGIVAWGLGASLGFPVGVSAASDDPVHAAARVSVVTSIAYTAFLAGPPLLGFVGDRVGTLHALLVVALLLIPSAMVVPAARERRS